MGGKYRNLCSLMVFVVTLRVSKVERESIEEDFAESIALKPNKWLVYLSPTVSHNLSLVLVKASDPSQNIVFEARNGNIAELKKMEKKLRECLKGITSILIIQKIYTVVTIC